MVKRFQDSSTRPTRALQAYLILIGKAANGETLTYSELDALMNFPAPVAIGWFLEYLHRYCRINELPLLPVLMVSKAVGEPSWDKYAPSEKDDVLAYDWYSLVPPTLEELERTFRLAKPSNFE